MADRKSYTPAIALRSSDGDIDEVGEWIHEKAQSLDRGVLEISPGDLIAMEGQHRIYGTRERLTAIKDEIAETKRMIEAAKKQESPVLDDLGKKLARLQDEYKALYELPVTVEILPITSELEWTQLYADVAQNAMGIGGDIKTSFDQSKVINRVARRLIDTHPLFVEKTEVGTGTPRPYWIKADGVAKIVHAVDKGIGGRYGRQDEKRANDDEVFKKASAFLDDLVPAFRSFRRSQSGTPEYADQRRREKGSIILSLSMLRGLGAAYRRLQEPKSRRVDFAPLTDKMGIPIDRKFWLKIAPTAFEWGTPEKPANPTAPGARGKRHRTRKRNRRVPLVRVAVTNMAEVDIWERLEQGFAQAPVAPTTPKQDAGKDDRSIRDWWRGVKRKTRWLDLAGTLFWLYAVTKIFVIDVDEKILEAIDPDLAGVLDYRILFYVLLLVAGVVFLGKWLFVAIPYILLFPLVVFFWKIPGFFVKRRSFPLVMAGFRPALACSGVFATTS